MSQRAEYGFTSAMPPRELWLCNPGDIPLVIRRLAKLALDKIPLRNKAVLGQVA